MMMIGVQLGLASRSTESSPDRIGRSFVRRGW
jgi:hypothetical protein